MEESIKLVLKKLEDIDSNVNALAVKVSEMDAKIEDMDDKIDLTATMVKKIYDEYTLDSEEKETKIRNIQEALDETRRRGMEGGMRA